MATTYNEPMRFRLRTLLIVVSSAIAGAVIGSVVFGPYAGLTPTDPRGPSIAAGLGGFVGLGIGLAIRVFVARWRSNT